MNPDVKKKWIAALRSGKYKQCRGRLRVRSGASKKHEYCVLGVLVQLYCESKHASRAKQFATFYAPSKEVQKWANLYDDHMNQLVGFNDDGLSTFNAIANYIEEHIQSDPESTEA